MRRTFREIGAFLSILTLALSVVGVAAPHKAAAQTAGSPFECNAEYYLATGQTNTQLSTLNVNRTPIDLTNIGAQYAPGYNAMGFRVQDGYIYGFDSFTNDQYVRIASDGSVTEIPAPPGIPAESYLAGDFDADGHHNMFASPAGANMFVVTDVSAATPQLLGAFALTYDNGGANVAVGDIAYNPKDGKFYGVDSLAKQVVMISIDKSTPGAFTGTLTHLSAVNDAFSGNLHGAAFIDARGRLVTFQVNPGELYRMNIGVNGSGTGAATKIGDAPTVVQYDGAACPYAPLLEKDASPRTVPEGSEVTYTYAMYNPLTTTPLTFNFSDTVDKGRTYVGSTLSDTFGGTANNYADTDTLTITNMTVPQGGSITFSVKVKIPNGLGGQTVLNQAVANNFSIPSLVAELRSDDSTTVIAGDPTAVQVTDASETLGTPNTGFGIITSNPLLFGGLLSVFAAGLVWLARRAHTAGQ